MSRYKIYRHCNHEFILHVYITRPRLRSLSHSSRQKSNGNMSCRILFLEKIYFQTLGKQQNILQKIYFSQRVCVCVHASHLISFFLERFSFSSTYVYDVCNFLQLEYILQQKKKFFMCVCVYVCAIYVQKGRINEKRASYVHHKTKSILSQTTCMFKILS